MHASAPSDSPRDRLLTPNDLAIYFDLPLSTIYGWRSKGTGPRGFRVGKFVRYRLADVEAWEQEQIEKEQAAHAG
ncbi:helix-turn-helix domain-containing protein [Micrococcus luteus]|uniref:helix-turn-helix transcriptional regulator n=1 Tax=Micrococcus luteus TaxID=1270 RepID=UPI001AA08F40|nr:helix-turn-helix domain-containing protein [Micrococcus luteus]MCM3553271.1 helix-turn-helix domain-containing protein [Micrococcus luteus]MCV7538937.1 helix-turn-helix domain-containing protein [Micrococcus luteus]